MKFRSGLIAALIVALGVGSAALGRVRLEPKQLGKKKQAKVDAAPLGSPQNPIRCEMPEGERAYLKRLRCPSGTAVNYNRVCSVDGGPYSTLMDRYDVSCPEWTEPVSVYMDMYHQGFVETRPVSPFSLAEPR